MKIYKYSMVKYLKMYSTWILLFFSLAINILMSVIFPFVLRNQSWFLYETNISLSIILSFSTITLLGAIYLALKVSQIFKSEIEDGSFLVLLSKPISRSRIFLEKWLAILTLTSIYTFINIFIYELFVIGLDPLSTSNSDSISHNIWWISILMFLLSFSVQLFFSSLSFLISLKYSTMITLGVLSLTIIYIPISSSIQIVYENKYDKLGNNSVDLTGFQLENKTINYINNLENQFQDFSISYDDINQTINLWNSVSRLMNNNSNQFVSNIYYQVNETNPYDYLFYLDGYNILRQISNFSHSNLESTKHLTHQKEKISQTLDKNKIVEKISNSMIEYKKIINDENYKKNFYVLLDIILTLRKIPNVSEKTNDQNYKNHLKELCVAIQNDKKQGTIQNFLKSPLISSIYFANGNDFKLDANLKEQLSIFEQMILTKLNIDFGFGTRILFNNSKIEKIYQNNNFHMLSTEVNENGEIVVAEDSKEYVDNFINNIDENQKFNQLIWEHFSVDFNGLVKINNQAIIDILNVIQLEERYGISIYSIDKVEYVNKGLLISLIVLLPTILISLSYYIYRKTDFR